MRNEINKKREEGREGRGEGEGEEGRGEETRGRGKFSGYLLLCMLSH